MKQHVYFRPILLSCIVLALLSLMLHRPAAALPQIDASVSINDAAMKLVQFCNEPKGSLDENALATLVDFVLSAKQSREYALPNSMESTGAYYEFDTKIAFPRFLEYSYGPLIPPSITRPSSLRYSVWAQPQGKVQKPPGSWQQIPPSGAPVIIHGMQRESDTPDLNTGAYHEYDLKRTLILLNYKGRQVLVSISKQIGQSNVGKKGAILGTDNDWNYYYSGEPGASITGLGWAKSYIYNLFSIGVYAESGTAPTMVKAGIFQWLRAGWSGINFVKSTHIVNGMKRFARDYRTVLESPHLPPPNQMLSVYHWLSNMPEDDLMKKYDALWQAQRSLAVQTGKISKSALNEQVSLAKTPKEQMIGELILDYLKIELGKPALLGKQSFLLPPAEDSGKPVPPVSKPKGSRAKKR